MCMAHLPAKVDCDSDVLGHDMRKEGHSLEGVVTQDKGSAKHGTILGEGYSLELTLKVLQGGGGGCE